MSAAGHALAALPGFLALVAALLVVVLALASFGWWIVSWGGR